MRKILILMVALISGLGFAQSLVVYPLDSEDISLGMAISDKLAESFSDSLETYGPAIANGLIPPISVEDGFFNITRRAPEVGTKSWVNMLREIVGADYLISGRVEYMGNDINAHIILSAPGASYGFDFTADADNPAAIVNSAVVVLASQMGLPLAGAGSELDLSASYGDYIDALSLAAFGEIEAAISRLESMKRDEKADKLLAALEAVRVGEAYDDSALMAVLSLALQPIDEQISTTYFENFAAQSSLPVAKLWLAVLSSSKGDSAKAAEYYKNIDFYPFGLASRAAFNRVQGLDYKSDERVVLAQNDTAALLAVASAANFAGDLSTEKQALRRLTEILPDYVYPFERLSFIAFDEDDALAAAQALAVAVRLEPESDLYWTNLGWSYYLLGILDKSETASLHAIELNPDEYIALFNLGLTRAVTGRLDEAIMAYNQAIALDPEVDDEAVHDLENARELYPNQADVHYALAYLYEQELRREEAAAEYRKYLDMHPDDPEFVEDAQARLEALLAPPAPFFISDKVTIGLSLAGIEAAPYHGGELIYPSFELYTDGDQLPRSVKYGIAIKDDETTLSSKVVDYSVPDNAIGYVIEDKAILIPFDILPGNYELVLTISTEDGRLAESVANLEVAEGRRLLRQLLSRDIIMYSVDDRPFYTIKDLNKTDEVLLAMLLDEIRSLVDKADEAIPTIDSGRFAGKTGAELFSTVSTQDIRDFLDNLLQTDANQSEFLFVDGFAQWAIEVAE